MAIENVLLGVAIHMLFWEHLPHWGTWFLKGVGKLPTSLQTLYEQWRCPYCAGFWIGLAVHAATGRWLFEAFATLPEFWGALGMPLGWFLDALVFALLNKLGVLLVAAIGWPALRGHKEKMSFLESKKAA
ncbi:hypothetical protein BXY66_0056 [Shimia isoporae]|uniref:Uncharacterized protein n=1 Tax=Shimia isoporae TaxID=647720 RepID=A0A4R1NJ44_9RHOB|nr:hypothetical protein [Shimia isoporae]TCL08025.1 hypothetical protein BXY66_0056 [Shimia isoporae]